MENKFTFVSKAIFLFVFVFSLSSYTHAQEAIDIPTNSVSGILGALGSDRTITIGPGKYDFSEESGSEGEFFSYQEVYDGKELVISNVKNLIIRGAGIGKTELVTRPTYGNVIVFKNCVNITIEGLTGGHGPKGECVGGVFKFENTSVVNLKNLDLYGSGVYGLEGENSHSITAEKVTIRECTYGLMLFTRCSSLNFKYCSFKDTQEYDLIDLTGCEMVYFNDCTFTNNSQPKDCIMESKLFKVEGSPVYLNNCTVSENRTCYLATYKRDLIMKNTKLSKNKYHKGEYQK